MTFDDIFKSNFLSNITSVTVLDMVLSLFLAFCLGVFIFLIYKKAYTGVMYAASFGVTLIALTMITTMIILAVTSNVVLSLGMVGALSIVRFRTAIKDPMDIAFLFWSLAAGIVVAAGMILLAVFGSVVIGLVLVVFSNRKSHDSPYILVVSLSGQEAEGAVKTRLTAAAQRHVIKSKTITADAVELNYEVRLKDGDTAFVNELTALPGVQHVALVSYNGDYMG